LAYNGTRALFIVVDVSGRITELVGGEQKCTTVIGESVSGDINSRTKRCGERTYMEPVRAYSVVESIRPRVLS
jgi:hypothetical protein